MLAWCARTNLFISIVNFLKTQTFGHKDFQERQKYLGMGIENWFKKKYILPIDSYVLFF